MIVSCRMCSTTDDSPWEVFSSVKFNVRVVRNLLEKPENEIPLFDILLNIKTVKVNMFVCVHACMHARMCVLQCETVCL